MSERQLIRGFTMTRDLRLIREQSKDSTAHLVPTRQVPQRSDCLRSGVEEGARITTVISEPQKGRLKLYVFLIIYLHCICTFVCLFECACSSVRLCERAGARA